MIVDLRIYTVRPGKVADYVALYKEYAWPLQLKYLERCLGWYTVTEGQFNQVVHLWGYESLADREKRRAALEADPEWAAYRAKSGAAGNVQHQENKILKSVSFSPM
jgi:hypothetical protein